MRRFVLAAGLFGLCGWSSPADQVTLKNGDHLTGTVVKSDGKVLLLKTEFAGDVNIHWDAVTGLAASETLHISLKDGQLVVGTVTTSADKFVVVTQNAGTVEAPIGAVTAVRDDAEEKAYEQEIARLRHPHLLDFWSALLDTGLNLTRGNSESLNFSLSSKAARVTERDKISVYSTAIYTNSTVNGVNSVTAHAIHGGVRGDLNMTNRLFMFGFTDFEYDQFQDLDLRNVIGGGAGLHIIKSKTTAFDTFAGGSLNQEFFGAVAATATKPAIPALNRKTAEIVVGETYNTKLNTRSTITEQFSFYPNISDTGNYRFQFDATAATKLKNWLAWQVTFSDRFLSDPLPGFKKDDLILATGLRFTVGKGTF